MTEEIEKLRHVILSTHPQLTENIKWNSPNYCLQQNDRITMKIYPPKQIQLIFHRGAKKLDQPKNKIISSPTKLLNWKENDRAVVTLKNMFQINESEIELKAIINEWIKQTS